MRKFTPLFIIVLVYLTLGSLYALRTPAWQAPDEPAHYNYIRQLANGRLPVMELGDYDEAYRNTVVSSRFDPQYDIAVITYEDWQPPLYYLLQTPIYWLTGGSLTALRLFSVLLGAGIIILAYACIRQLFPKNEWIAWTTAVVIAFLPQHLAIMASINNDALSELLIAAILLAVITWAQQEKQDTGLMIPIIIGVLLGLAFITKGTAYLMAPVVGSALLWQYRGRWSALRRYGLALFLPALLLGGVWWGRNLMIYGGLDFLGKTRHDAVVIGQIRTAEWVTQFGLTGTIQRFLQTTFNSFWGQFGWMAVPMPLWIYRPLSLLTITAVLGLLLAIFTRRAHDNINPQSRIATLPFILLLLLFALTLSLHVGYNLTFVQHQGRYLFPALIPIALGMTLGLGAWVNLITRPFATHQHTFFYLLPIGLGMALVSLNLYALLRFIPLL